MPKIPNDFLWGAATSAYQIEGAVTAGERGRSIWDSFAETPGRIRNGDTGAVACDHYHRFREDVALLRGAGLGAYRFSISWPRIQPTGAGEPNAAGLDFYDRLIDELLAARIQPWATLFHWDLPQVLQDAGGWLSRDTAHRFGEYAGIVADRLGDRLAGVMTLNEPWIVTHHGHLTAEHAPGLTLGADALLVGHEQLVAHGLAVQALRAAGARRVGIANAYSPAWPATPTDSDRLAALTFDMVANRFYTDPVLLGEYPVLLLDLLRDLAPEVLAELRTDDLPTIAQPLDFLGVNYYLPLHVAVDPANPLRFSTRPPTGFDTTGNGWPVVPKALTSLLTDLQAIYRQALPPVLITENGYAQSGDDLEDLLADAERIDYLQQHFDAVADAIGTGTEVAGYFVWSLLDNFEWAAGYSERFGLVHVDFDTQRRTPKDSYRWLAERQRRAGG